MDKISRDYREDKQKELTYAKQIKLKGQHLINIAAVIFVHFG